MSGDDYGGALRVPECATEEVRAMMGAGGGLDGDGDGDGDGDFDEVPFYLTPRHNTVDVGASGRSTDEAAAQCVSDAPSLAKVDFKVVADIAESDMAEWTCSYFSDNSSHVSPEDPLALGRPGPAVRTNSQGERLLTSASRSRETPRTPRASQSGSKKVPAAKVPPKSLKKDLSKARLKMAPPSHHGTCTAQDLDWTCFRCQLTPHPPLSTSSARSATPPLGLVTAGGKMDQLSMILRGSQNRLEKLEDPTSAEANDVRAEIASHEAELRKLVRKGRGVQAPSQGPRRGVGRPRCCHRRVTGLFQSETYRNPNAQVFSTCATCLDSCRSCVKQCPDCHLWQNYK